VHPARLVGVDALLRGLVDMGLAAALVVTVAPALMAVLTVAWLRGVRPLFVSKQILGQGGIPITLYLLNPRVSGRFVLRGFPALLAVLQGRLALVGPRPLPLEEAAKHRPWFKLLLSVKPGLTGPWRLVNPELTPEERLFADVWWVRNWSIWQHLFVLAQTVYSISHGAPRDREVQRWDANMQRRTKQVAA
jgi:lipopolysaccharide/colanic/teichoic acid biosynthesis glycosyltransferase